MQSWNLQICTIIPMKIYRSFIVTFYIYLKNPKVIDSIVVMVGPHVNIYIWFTLLLIQIGMTLEKSFSFFRVTCNIQCPGMMKPVLNILFSFSFLQFELCLGFCCVGQEPIRYLKSLRGLKITDVTSLSLWFNKSNFLC